MGSNLREPALEQYAEPQVCVKGSGLGSTRAGVGTLWSESPLLVSGNNVESWGLLPVFDLISHWVALFSCFIDSFYQCNRGVLVYSIILVRLQQKIARIIL